MLTYHIIPVTPFQQNCSVLACKETQKAVVIDPGGDLEKIKHVIEQKKLCIEKILLTHGHIDHAGMAKQLSDDLAVPLWGPHKNDQFWLEQLPMQSQLFGFSPHQAFAPSKWLIEGEEISFGKITLHTLLCPGHTPGHIVFIDKENKLAVVGDVLFQGSIGRTDFPQSNQQDLIDSITKKLFPLGDDFRFIPGHGPMSTFGNERKNNPFVASGAFR